MCLSIPMQIVALENESGEFAIVERREGESLQRERVNLMLIGRQPPGTWILASLGLAREVLDDQERALIEDALAALAASLAGRHDSSEHFTDLRDTINELNDRQ